MPTLRQLLAAGHRHTVVEPYHGPIMYSFPEFMLGYPVSVFDLHRVSPGEALPDDMMIPCDGDYWRADRLAPDVVPHHYEAVPRAVLHEEAKRGRGRPSPLFKYSREKLRDFRLGYYQGLLNQTDIAEMFGISQSSVSRFVRGETLWWV